MMRFFFFLIILSFTIVISEIPVTAASQFNTGEQALEKAEDLYKEGKREEAKEYFQLAAKQGFAEAHYQLAYCYVLTKDEEIDHLVEAAKQGHEKALELALDRLFFRANNLFSDPQKALDLYYQAKRANPSLKMYQEERVLETLKMSAESGAFDAEAFIQQHKILIPSSNDDAYYVWELAERASKGGCFGDPDPKLVLQLVSRGGLVPAELMAAVKKTYANWKTNNKEEFKIDNFVTSGFGYAFVSSRRVAIKEKERQSRIDLMSESMTPEKVNFVRFAYKAAKEFIRLKVEYSELADIENVYYGGSLESGCVTREISSQMDEYTALINNVNAGFTPSLTQSNLELLDKELNKVYLKVRQALRKKPEEDSLLISVKIMQDIQLAWIKHRDASARLFSALNPKVDELAWKAYITEIRVDQLEKLFNSSILQGWVQRK